MAESSEHIQFVRVARHIDPRAKLRRYWTLTGGISAQVVGLEIEWRGGEIQKMVFRRHGADDLANNPQIAADEFALLHILTADGLPVPAPYHLDDSGAIFPTPYLVVEFIDGAPDFTPVNLSDFLGQLADVLARMHAVDGATPALDFLPRLADQVAKTLRNRPAVLDDSLDEGRIRDALAAAWPLPQTNPLTLAHGDFWPGNVLWKDGELQAVIDWEDAVRGDPLADLAICGWNCCGHSGRTPCTNSPGATGRSCPRWMR
ncbi:MAG: phosphotransferase, partial [Anaerolineae bacterium]|nr:phosphotransferase [Anaerolineae bacterium]